MKTSLAIGEKILKGRKKAIILQQQKELLENWPDVRAHLTGGGEEGIDPKNRGLFLEGLKREMDKSVSYIPVVQSLDSALSAVGTQWLQSICDGILERTLGYLPSCRKQ
jgi:hypothetical protein